MRVLTYLGMALVIPFLFLRTKASAWDAWFGELSYPMYLSHILVIQVLQWLGTGTSSWFWLQVAVVTIVFSAVVHELVTKPLERLRQRRILQAGPA